MKTIFAYLLTLVATTISSNYGYSQEEQKSGISVNPFDGVMAAGYVDNGAYLNFTGPNINYVHGKSKVMLGMLPSLRYKEDHSVIKNSPITPNLGVGLTFCYHKIALQIPLYYNAKTTTTNGKWNIGIGIGYRFK